MEWQAVTVIITLGGFLLAIVAPIVKLNTIITRLATLVDSMQKSQEEASVKNTESHRRLWEHNAEQDGKITDHETRIGRLGRRAETGSG